MSNFLWASTTERKGEGKVYQLDEVAWQDMAKRSNHNDNKCISRDDFNKATVLAFKVRYSAYFGLCFPIHKTALQTLRA